MKPHVWHYFSDDYCLAMDLLLSPPHCPVNIEASARGGFLICGGSKPKSYSNPCSWFLNGFWRWWCQTIGGSRNGAGGQKRCDDRKWRLQPETTWWLEMMTVLGMKIETLNI